MLFTNFVVSLAVVFASFGGVNAGYFPDAYICSACAIVLGLVEEAGLQIRLDTYLRSKCTSTACQDGVTFFIHTLEKHANPDEVCKDVELCTGECTLYSKWPVSLPPQPYPWPVERRLSETGEKNNLAHVGPLLRELFGTATKHDDVPLLAHVAMGVANFLRSDAALVAEDLSAEKTVRTSASVKDYAPCGRNLTCHIEAISNHMPLQDADGDRYSTIGPLRGTDWRGGDCDDARTDVYPGRKAIPSGYEGDHNCNGIVGGNATGSYESIFCDAYPPRGLIMLGDSATAHFHIPPQWVTAQGWNIDGLLDVAMNEMDDPACSWGTGFKTLEECPHQLKLDGIDGIISLYTQMRDRNRCSANDFQNIGVNGARMTSSHKLVNAMARDPQHDQPALVWLSLIGNDVCNGHPGFDHMTTPEEYYDSAMTTLTELDALLPAGSHVVSLALFDGEMLYDTMHAHQHPVGCSYRDIYTFMNCLEENPCWGWLNENATVRQLTTKRSNELNNMSRKIEREASFKNFKFIFYAPHWGELFLEYLKTGNKLTDLIEPVDGFHPSQTGNALFAYQFWKFLEDNHPDALGPVNPHNAEIDAMFFNKQK